MLSLVFVVLEATHWWWFTLILCGVGWWIYLAVLAVYGSRTLILLRIFSGNVFLALSAVLRESLLFIMRYAFCGYRCQLD